jgi:hypothetical protein
MHIPASASILPRSNSACFPSAMIQYKKQQHCFSNLVHCHPNLPKYSARSSLSLSSRPPQPGQNFVTACYINQNGPLPVCETIYIKTDSCRRFDYILVCVCVPRYHTSLLLLANTNGQTDTQIVDWTTFAKNL